MAPRARRGLKRLTVSGFKSILEPQTIEFAPLTLLSGSNSAGKSSMLQALLLLKQTLDSAYDPGPLLLNGPHVKFTAPSQLFSRLDAQKTVSEFSITLELENGEQLTTVFVAENRRIRLATMTSARRGAAITLRENIEPAAILPLLPESLMSAAEAGRLEFDPVVRRKGCFFWLSAQPTGQPYTLDISPAEPFANELRQVIHLPGLRGNPERSYPVSAVSGAFPGAFQAYVASVIAQWQEAGNAFALKAVSEDLAFLGLGFGLAADEAGETELRLRIGRVVTERGDDLVNIADVGLGVSQTLPILLALHVAQRGQIVFIEEPEIHLHPRAQVRLTEILAREARRGVKIVVETHSPLILLGIQTAVARGLSTSDVALYWFQRDAATGVTTATRATLDELGRFGEWPVDFGDVSLSAHENYMEAGARRADEPN